MASCDTSSTSEKEATKEEKITIVTVVDGEIIQKVSDAELKALAAKYYNKISDDVQRTASFFSEVFIGGSGSHYYIIGKATNSNGNCVSVATPLAVSSPLDKGNKGSSKGAITLSEDPTPPEGEEGHKCEGNPCNDCDFTYEGEQIDGCSCDSDWPMDHCDHTVTTED